jgi:ribosomal protein S18 acetylase RimI-like enzyme
MNETVAIRRGGPADRAFALDLGLRVAFTSVSPLRVALSPAVDSAFERLMDFAWSRDHELLVADDGATPVGFALIIYDLPDEVSLTDQAFVAYMAVEPASRRRGIAASLLATAERLAVERGLAYVSLMVTEENVPALALYERDGFRTERRMMTKAL